MQSLRSRRSQAPRQPQRAPTSSNRLAKSNGPRDVRKSKVDDRIKKRMSTRYADISGPTELAIPAVPSLPAGVGAAEERRRAAAAGGDQEELVADRSLGDARKGDDLERMLDDDLFDPDTYLKAKLANSTESELRTLQSSLRGAKDGVASDLQRNVFKNYAEFVTISKEISSLENELLELKESLSEYKSMPALLHVPDPSSSSTAISTFRRSSMADLRIMYFNQMQTLHAQIEGSSKFAPNIPGRHVIGEIEDILSLNSATYKPIGKVKFVVLDDLVLVARRRRRHGAGSGGSMNAGSSDGKLVAERCWPINEMLVLDTKDSPSMTNVFKIRHGKETHVYRSQSASDKKSLLAQFKQVAEELAAKKRKEREGEHERRKTMLMNLSGSEKSPPMPDWMAELAEKAGEGSSSAKEKADRDSHWVSEWSDDLSVSIALKQWDEAVKLVEDGKAKLATISALAVKLPPLTSLLTTSLLSALSLPSNRKTTVVHLISLLIRLDAGLPARRTFLETRERVMMTLIRKIPFTGDIANYVSEMCMVWFTAIKHTADWFLASFKENEVASSFVEWSKKQIETYAEMFRTQVYGSDVGQEVIDEALRTTFAQSKKLLQEYGLDFRFLLDQLLAKDPPSKADARMSKPFSFRVHSIQIPKHDVDSSVLSAFLSPGSSASATPSRLPSIPLRRRGSPTPPMPSQPMSASVVSSYDRGSGNSDLSGMAYPASATLPTTSSRPPTPTRTRTPNPPSSAATLDPPPLPMIAPSPRRTRTPPPPSQSRQGHDSNVAAVARERPPRAMRGSPAPPPRSSNRPGSSAMHRPTPVAVPPREGMF